MLKSTQRVLVVFATAALTGCGAQGSVASHDSTAAKVKSWRGIQVVEPVAGGDATAPRIALDADGNGVLVWQQGGATRATDRLWLSQFRAGGAWDTPRPLNMPGKGHAERPQVVFDSAGNLLLAWTQSDGTRRNIWAVRVSSAGTWGEMQLLEQRDGDAAELSLAADGKGNAFAVWRQDSGAGSGIWSTRYTAASGWGPAQRLENGFPGSAERPALAVDAAGNALVAWQTHDTDGSNVWSARFRAGQSWSRPVRLNRDAVAASPHVVLDRQGNGIAVWQQRKDARWGVAASHFQIGTDWSEPQIIADRYADARLPQVASGRSGDGVVVWEQQQATRCAVWASRYTVAAGWSGAERIDGNPGSHARQPQVAFNGDGEAVVAWRQVDGAHSNIVTTRFNAGRWSVPEILDTDNIGALNTAVADQPQLAFEPGGNAVAVWRQQDVGARGVRLSHFR
jgi:hypothetical protein